MGIDLGAFGVAGGLIVALMGFQMLFGGQTSGPQGGREADEVPESFEGSVIVPYAIPFVAGPGAITTVITISSSTADWTGTIAALIAVGVSVVLLPIGHLFVAQHLNPSPQTEQLLTRIGGLLVATIGIQPRSASTAFGYIESGERLDVDAAPSARSIVRFVEKPDLATARQYVESGAFSWNAGMFVTRTEVLLDHLARLQPHLHAGLVRIAASWDTDRRTEVLEETWPALTPIAIDHAVAEPVSLEGGMAVVPGTFGWDDVGDFAALHEIVGRSDASTVWVDANGYARAEDGRTIAVVGLRDVVVVSTPDAVLVTSVREAQRVKEVPARLKDVGRSDLV